VKHIRAAGEHPLAEVGGGLGEELARQAGLPVSLYSTRSAIRSVLPLLPPGLLKLTTRAPGALRQSTAVSHSLVSVAPKIGTSSIERATGLVTFSASAWPPT
jgi:hypothetical protein